MKQTSVPLNMIINLGRDMRAFIAIHTDEELIRLQRRARNAGHQSLADVLATEIEGRDQIEKKLSALNL
jgi:hypothetical protein